MSVPQQTPVKKDVVVGIPCYDNRIDVQIYREVLDAIADPTCVVGGILHYNGDSLIPRGRNKLARMFMESPFTYLMFIDSDIMFDRKQINRLRSHSVGIIGGVYLKKTLPYQPVLNSAIGQKGELLVMKEIGTGFMMIRRDVFGAFRAMWPEHDYKFDQGEPNGINHDWFRVGVREGRYLSEDWYFCQLAAELGYPSYIDPQVRVIHIGKAQYPMPDSAIFETAAQLIDALPEDLGLDREVAEKLRDKIGQWLGKKYGSDTSAPTPSGSTYPTLPIASRYTVSDTATAKPEPETVDDAATDTVAQEHT